MEPQNYHSFDREKYYLLKQEGIDYMEMLQKASRISKKYFDNTYEIQTEEIDERLILML